MRIAFAVDEDKGLDSVISYHFGRCPFYLFVDIENDEVKSVTAEQNPFDEGHGPGVIPQFIHDRGAEVIVCGNMGPKARDFFSSLGVRPVTGAYGKVKDALMGVNIKPGSTPPHIIHEQHGEKTEVERLKEEIVDLRRQIAEINEKLNTLLSNKGNT